jgi:hypothetical protein
MTKRLTLVSLLAFPICAFAQDSTPSQRLLARAHAFQDSIAAVEALHHEAERKRLIRSMGLPKRIERAAVERRVVVGMSAPVVRLSWGDPEEINYTTTAAGTTEQWVYDINRYVYVGNGTVTAIQGSYRP